MAERVVFSRSLYRPDAVEATAEAYGGLARIEIDQGEDSIVATLHDPEPDFADELVDAFCNHALHETIVRHRQHNGGEL